MSLDKKACLQEQLCLICFFVVVAAVTAKGSAHCLPLQAFLGRVSPGPAGRVGRSVAGLQGIHLSAVPAAEGGAGA